MAARVRLAASMAEATLSSFTVREFCHSAKSHVVAGQDEELCDTIASTNLVGRYWVGIDEDDLDLPAVSRVY
jgi:hypothetical protein